MARVLVFQIVLTRTCRPYKDDNHVVPIERAASECLMQFAGHPSQRCCVPNPMAALPNSGARANANEDIHANGDSDYVVHTLERKSSKQQDVGKMDSSGLITGPSLQQSIGIALSKPTNVSWWAMQHAFTARQLNGPVRRIVWVLAVHKS